MRQIARDLLRALLHRHNNTWTAFLVVDNRGLGTVMRLTTWVPVQQLVHAKCCKNGQRCVFSFELILETEQQQGKPCFSIVL